MQPIIKLLYLVFFCVAFFFCSFNVYSSELSDAIDSGMVQQVEKILNNAPSLLNTKNTDGLTPLNQASYKGKIEIVQYLLSRGADLTIGDNENSRPIHNAAVSGHIDVVMLLLANGADINVQDDNGYTPIMWAVLRGHPELVDSLLSKSANIYLKDNYTRTAFFMAIMNRNVEIARSFVEAGVNVNIVCDEPFLPITWAIFRGDLAMVEMLVANGADVQVTSSLGESFLHFAVFHNKPEIVKYLIKSGIDVNVTKRGNLTPLHIAAIASNTDMTDVVNILIDFGANLDIRSNDGGTPLHYAQSSRNSIVVDILKERGAKELPRNFTKYSGKYLGAKTPGDEPILFVPEIFRDIYSPHSQLAFSPDGKEVYWEGTFMRGVNNISRVWFMKEENGVWQAPQVAPFAEYPSGGPMFFNNGQKLIYSSLRPRDTLSTLAEDLDLWMVERTAGGWSEPIHLDSPINNDGSNDCYPSILEDGTIYLERRNKGGYVKYGLVDGKYKEIGVIGDFFNNDYIDSCKTIDEFFIVTDMRTERFYHELFICFHQPDGRWTKPIYMGDRLHKGERVEFAQLSPDRKYLFFSRTYFTFYWVDAKIIDDLKPDYLK